jgi:hypothetical protein
MFQKKVLLLVVLVLVVPFGVSVNAETANYCNQQDLYTFSPVVFPTQTGLGICNVDYEIANQWVEVNGVAIRPVADPLGEYDQIWIGSLETGDRIQVWEYAGRHSLRLMDASVLEIGNATTLNRIELSGSGNALVYASDIDGVADYKGILSLQNPETLSVTTDVQYWGRGQRGWVTGTISSLIKFEQQRSNGWVSPVGTDAIATEWGVGFLTSSSVVKNPGPEEELLPRIPDPTGEYKRLWLTQVDEEITLRITTVDSVPYIADRIRPIVVGKAEMLGVGNVDIVGEDEFYYVFHPTYEHTYHRGPTDVISRDFHAISGPFSTVYHGVSEVSWGMPDRTWSSEEYLGEDFSFVKQTSWHSFNPIMVKNYKQ